MTTEYCLEESSCLNHCLLFTFTSSSQQKNVSVTSGTKDRGRNRVAVGIFGAEFPRVEATLGFGVEQFRGTFDLLELLGNH